MERLKVTRAGEVKEVNTKFGLKKKQGVQFKEYPNVWHDVWASGIKEGDVLEGTRTSREWEGKTYWNFVLPNKNDAVSHKLEQILTTLGMMSYHIKAIAENTKTKLTSAGTPIPFNEDSEREFHTKSPAERETARTKMDEVRYPEEDINVEDIPF